MQMTTKQRSEDEVYLRPKGGRGRSIRHSVGATQKELLRSSTPTTLSKVTSILVPHLALHDAACAFGGLASVLARRRRPVMEFLSSGVNESARIILVFTLARAQ